MGAVQGLNAGLRRVPVWPFYIVLFLPACWWLYLGLTGGLGANPVKALEHKLGEFALQLLVASLCVTPILHMTRLNLIRFRRMIGLMAFWYVVLHFLTYLALDLQFYWDEIGKDLTKRPYIIVGFLVFLLLIPLAVTSNDLSVRRLGSAFWRRIHMLVFPASILAVLHYLWLVKVWTFEPLAYAALVGALCLWRVSRTVGQRRSRPA